jgi:hypothetical protein
MNPHDGGERRGRIVRAVECEDWQRGQGGERVRVGCPSMVETIRSHAERYERVTAASSVTNGRSTSYGGY